MLAVKMRFAMEAANYLVDTNFEF